MDSNSGNAASGSASKKDKKSKKNYEDGDTKKKFVSIFPTWRTLGVMRASSQQPVAVVKVRAPITRRSLSKAALCVCALTLDLSGSSYFLLYIKPTIRIYSDQDLIPTCWFYFYACYEWCLIWTSQHCCQ